MTMRNEQAGRRTLLQTDAWQKRGTIEEIRVKAILLSLCEALRSVHREGKTFGHVSPQHIVVDDKGGLSLDPAVHRAASNAEQLFGVLPDGYAAFEQYMGEPDWQTGPWTDVHGLSALAYALVVGEPPSNAVARMVARSDITFDARAEEQFSATFLAAVARGLSLDQKVRQQSVDEFALGIGAAAVPGILMKADVSAPARVATAEVDPDTAAASTLDSDERMLGQSYAEKVSSFRWQMPIVLAIVAAIGIVAWQAVGGHGADATDAAVRDQVAVSALTGPDLETDIRPDAALIAMTDTADDVGAAALDAPDVSLTAGLPADLPADAAISSMPGVDSDEQSAETSDLESGVPPISLASGPIETSVSASATTPLAEDSFDAAGVNSPAAAMSHKTRETDASPGGQAKAAVSPEKSPKRQVESRARSVKVPVDVRPWGEVFVNGASRGVSPPLKSLALPPGTYQIRIVNGDLPIGQFQLTVKQGASARIAHTFSAGGD